MFKKHLLYFLYLVVGSLQAEAIATSTDELIQASNEFAFDLQAPLNISNANCVYSPFSIYYCLSMACSGAEDSTREILETALHWPFERSLVAMAAKQMIHRLLNNDDCDKETTRLRQASTIFVDFRTQLKEDFKHYLQDNFGASIQGLDLANKDFAAKTINNWVSRATEHKISQLLTPSDLSDETRMLLINAIYFRGHWQHTFNTTQTSRSEFYTSAEHIETVDMMAQSHHFDCYIDSHDQVAILPFTSVAGGPKLAFIVAMPTSADDFEQWFSTINPSQVQKWLSQSESRFLLLKMPKFCLHLKYDLRAVLAQLGLEELFREDANFSSISDNPALSFNKVLHEAYLDLNEVGVEAAAVTSISIGTTSCNYPPLRPYPFIANRPFAFFLIDTSSGLILFQGKLVHIVE